jgi:hypothetical protein
MRDARLFQAAVDASGNLGGDMDKINYGSLPAILLAAVWGATDVVLKALEILNPRRDELLKISHDAVLQHPQQPDSVIRQMNDILWSDYFLLSLGIVAFCAIFTILVYKIPTFFREDEEIQGLTPAQKLTIDHVEMSMRKACLLVALFGILGILAFGLGGAWDVVVLHQEIQQTTKLIGTPVQSNPSLH